MSTSPLNNDEKLQKASRSEIYWQVGTSIAVIAIITTFLLGDFQVKVPGINFSITSIGCWVLSEDEKTARTAYNETYKIDNDYTKKLEEARAKFDEKEKDLKVEGLKATLETNFGNLVIQPKYSETPIIAENFARLIYRGYYDNTVFHRIVKKDGFNLIQGGDPEATGQGGDSAFGFDLKDEIPQKYPNGIPCNINFQEESRKPITYKKGQVAMANRGANTNGSQFFILLEDTQLPPSYTIFGELESGQDLLDKIKQEVEPLDETGATTDDGKPSKEIKINKARLD